MYSVATAASASHDRITRAMNSDPLSLRMCPGAPRWATTADNTSFTFLAVLPRPTSRTRHSRVHSSTTVNHFSGRPSLVRSWKKSHARTWLAYSARLRAQLLALDPNRRFFRCFLGTFRPCCLQSR